MSGAQPGDERVVLASAVAVDLLLHPAPDLVECLGAELDDVEGVEHGDAYSSRIGCRLPAAGCDGRGKARLHEVRGHHELEMDSLIPLRLTQSYTPRLWTC